MARGSRVFLRVVPLSNRVVPVRLVLRAQEIESRIARGQVGIEDDDDAPAFKPAFDSFLEGLTNRNAADDRSRGRRHLLPKFARMTLADVGLASVMEWTDEQRATGALSEASIRHNMNLLSRFFSWAIARDKASINPVRQIPMGSRPTQTVKSDTPWLDDDAIVRKLIGDLEEPINFMFYLCNRSRASHRRSSGSADGGHGVRRRGGPSSATSRAKTLRSSRCPTIPRTTSASAHASTASTVWSSSTSTRS